MVALKKIALAATAAFVVGSVPALATPTPVTYDLTLTASSGPAITGGTGSFTISFAPCTTFNCQSSYYRNPTPAEIALGDGVISALSITIDGDTFLLTSDTNPGDNPLIRFTNQTVDDITYHGHLANGDDLQMTSSFQFTLSGARASTYGTFTAKVDPPAVAAPEPASLALLGAGLAGLSFAGRKRRAKLLRA